MVFRNIVNLVRSKGPDEFWRKRKIFKLAAHYHGRPRNVFSLTIRNVQRALAYATTGRKLKKLDINTLWATRVEAACQQYGVQLDTFKETLARCNILLNKKSLADLAIWEPRSFETLIRLSRERAVADELSGISERSVMNQVYGLNNLNKK